MSLNIGDNKLLNGIMAGIDFRMADVEEHLERSKAMSKMFTSAREQYKSAKASGDVKEMEDSSHRSKILYKLKGFQYSKLLELVHAVVESVPAAYRYIDTDGKTTKYDLFRNSNNDEEEQPGAKQEVQQGADDLAQQNRAVEVKVNNSNKKRNTEEKNKKRRRGERKPKEKKPSKHDEPVVEHEIVIEYETVPEPGNPSSEVANSPSSPTSSTSPSGDETQSSPTQKKQRRSRRTKAEMALIKAKHTSGHTADSNNMSASSDIQQKI